MKTSPPLPRFPGVTQPAPEPSIGQLLEWATGGRDADTTVDRVRFELGSRTRPPSDVNRLVARLWERFECWRRNDQYVWVSDRERLIVVQSWWIKEIPYRNDKPKRMPMIDTTIEVWSSADGYHARLDELAGVEG